MSDIVIGAMLTNGRDDFRTGRKVTGNDDHINALSIEHKLRYMLPFTTSANQFPSHQFVAIHDGLVDICHIPPVSYCCAVGLPDWNALERRWVGILNYLYARNDVERVWMVDVNDVLFVTDPFHWLDSYLKPGNIAVGQEQVLMGDNEWYEAGVKPLPAEYGYVLTKRHGSKHGLSCGAWAAHRTTTIEILDSSIQRIVKMQEYLRQYPVDYAVCLDMFAFSVTWLTRFSDRLVRFAMDGETTIGDVPSPLIHDRQKCMDRITDLSLQEKG